MTKLVFKGISNMFRMSQVAKVLVCDKIGKSEQLFKKSTSVGQSVADSLHNIYNSVLFFEAHFSVAEFLQQFLFPRSLQLEPIFNSLLRYFLHFIFYSLTACIKVVTPEI